EESKAGNVDKQTGAYNKPLTNTTQITFTDDSEFSTSNVRPDYSKYQHTARQKFSNKKFIGMHMHQQCCHSNYRCYRNAAHNDEITSAFPYCDARHEHY